MYGNTIILIHMRLLVTVVDGKLTPRRTFYFQARTPQKNTLSKRKSFTTRFAPQTYHTHIVRWWMPCFTGDHVMRARVVHTRFCRSRVCRDCRRSLLRTGPSSIVLKAASRATGLHRRLRWMEVPLTQFTASATSSAPSSKTSMQQRKCVSSPPHADAQLALTSVRGSVWNV